MKTPIVVATLLTAGLVFWSSYKVKTGVPERIGQADVPSVIVEAEIDKESVSEIESPDSKAVLIMKNTIKGNLLHQAFLLKHVKDGSQSTIYEKDSSEDDKLSIPFNTFSPDNKYIFLQVGTTEPKYIVFRTDGKNLKANTKIVEVAELFNAKYPDLDVTDVTGWGGISVLVVNTNDKNGKKNASFWFDLSNLSFYRLATRFN